MKNLWLLLFAFSIFSSVNCFAQGCPPNIDFEMGNFSGWDCFIGTTSAVAGKNNINLSPSPPVAGRHTIISSTSSPFDSYGGFPTLCPYGGKYSVKLGNTSTGAEAEGLSYTFTVPLTVDTFTFTYFYAVVFQNPNHLEYEQPRFFVTAYDVVTGKVVSCASYDYVASGGLPGFEISKLDNSVLYKNWTPTSLQFAGLAGRTVRLEFKTADCTRTGHFGYAYLDVASGCTNILATAPYCVETNSLILNAPYGFQNYTWYNNDFTTILGKQQSLTLSPPPANTGFFNVDVEPYPGYGCRDTFQAIVRPLPVPEAPYADSVYTYCQYSFAPPLTAKVIPGNDLLWYTTATGGVGQTKAPIPNTQKAGVFDYYVSQKVLFGCESFRKKITVTIIPKPNVAFNINAAKQCFNTNQFINTSTSGNLSNPTYTWDFGDGQSFSSAIDSITNHVYSNVGNYNVKLSVTNQATCTSSIQMPVSIIPNPAANFNVNKTTQCFNSNLLISTSSSNNLSNPTYTWDFGDGQQVSTKIDSIIKHVYSNPGNYNIKLSITNQGTCTSDTQKIITIIPGPIVGFNINAARQCLNSNQFISTSTSGNLSNPTYTWDFGDGQSVSSENDSIVNHVYNNAGSYNIKLSVTNQSACTSDTQMAVVILPKPIASFDYPSVVCQQQTNINVQDKSFVPGGLSTVNQWWWSFDGTILQSQNPSTFIPQKAGNLLLKQVVETAEGCTSDTNTVVIPVHYRPNASFTYSHPLCNNEIIYFSDKSNLPQAPTTENIVKWNWQFDNLGTSTQVNPQLFLANGIFNIKLQTETNFGCKSELADSIIEIHAKPEIKITISDSCVLKKIYYNAENSNGSNVSWFWNFGNGYFKDNSQIIKSFSSPGEQSFSIMARSEFGCKDTLERAFTLYDNIAFAGKDTVAAMNEPVQLYANGYAGTKYHWTPSQGLDSDTIMNPVATLDRDQLYRMDAVTKEGCEVHSNIFIKRYKGPELYIPNAFSPNGDGKNDVLKVIPVGIKSFGFLAVYDRWGKMIYRTSSYYNGWDGTLNGSLLPPGTYVAVAEAIDYRGKPMMQKTAVVLIR